MGAQLHHWAEVHLSCCVCVCQARQLDPHEVSVGACSNHAERLMGWLIHLNITLFLFTRSFTWASPCFNIHISENFSFHIHFRSFSSCPYHAVHTKQALAISEVINLNYSFRNIWQDSASFFFFFVVYQFDLLIYGSLAAGNGLQIRPPQLNKQVYCEIQLSAKQTKLLLIPK